MAKDKIAQLTIRVSKETLHFFNKKIAYEKTLYKKITTSLFLEQYIDDVIAQLKGYEPLKDELCFNHLYVIANRNEKRKLTKRIVIRIPKIKRDNLREQLSKTGYSMDARLRFYINNVAERAKKKGVEYWLDRYRLEKGYPI